MPIRTVIVRIATPITQGLLKQASLVLTDADIKQITGDGSLRTIVPATEFTDFNQFPAIVPVLDSVQLFIHFAVGAYGNDAPRAGAGEMKFVVVLGTNDANEITEIALNEDETTINFEDATDQLMYHVPVKTPWTTEVAPLNTIEASELVDNALLVQLTNSLGALTGGGDGNYIKVTITYHLFDTGLTPSPPP